MPGHTDAEDREDASIEMAAPDTDPKGEQDVNAEARDEAASRAEELERLNADLSRELSELKDQYLRKCADFENFRKRVSKERDDAIQFANQNLLLDIVSLLDDFDRALKSLPEGAEEDPLYQGVAMAEKQFASQLERKWGLVRYETVGREFDPNVHEAVSVVKDPECEAPVVVEEYMRGYCLHDRVIRSAKVRVKMPADKVPEAGSQE